MNYPQFPHRGIGWDESLDCHRPFCRSLILELPWDSLPRISNNYMQAHTPENLKKGVSAIQMHNLCLCETINTDKIEKLY